VDAHPALTRIVVHESDRRLAELRTSLHLARDKLARLSTADDQHLLTLGQHRATRGSLDHAADRQPHPPDQDHGQEQIDRGDRAGQIVVGRRQDEQPSHQDQAGGRCRLQDRLEIAQPDIAPPLLIEAESREYRDLAQHHEGNRLPEQILVAGRNALVKPQQEGTEVGKREQRRIRQNLKKTVAIHRILRRGKALQHQREFTARSA
jgi:hypothetical protein